MIKIDIKENSISLKGHAGYDEKGKDIVCAAVSILVNTFINLYDVNVIDRQDEMSIMWKNADTDFLITGLKILERNYPENVSIKKV